VQLNASNKFPHRSALAVVFSPMAILLLFGFGCSPSATTKVPFDLQERFPAVADLRLPILGQAGAAESGSAALFQEIAAAQKALGALDLFGVYRNEGGEQDRNLTIILALEGAPRVVDQVVRYSRDDSRLDLERIGDHAFFYLQYGGQGYDPNNSISEDHLLIEGSTVAGAKLGSRAQSTQATGLANSREGYLRFHFNHRPQDQDPLHSAAQLNYRFEDNFRSYHLTYFVRPEAQDKPARCGFWLRLQSDGRGLIYTSQQQGTTSTYTALGQFHADGSVAVWKDDGTLWGCYDAKGNELGHSAEACADFSDGFVDPPAGLEIWPTLPASLPHLD
jgi:hypothetical protein